MIFVLNVMDYEEPVGFYSSNIRNKYGLKYIKITESTNFCILDSKTSSIRTIGLEDFKTYVDKGIVFDCVELRYGGFSIGCPNLESAMLMSVLEPITGSFDEDHVCIASYAIDSLTNYNVKIRTPLNTVLYTNLGDVILYESTHIDRNKFLGRDVLRIQAKNGVASYRITNYQHFADVLNRYLDSVL